jgi:broad specificity phosphatase PhoE
MTKKPQRLIVYLVRHGRKDMDRFRKNQGEPCFLSKIGGRQAECLAKKFKGEKIDKIFVSNHERCIQTAEPTSRELSLPLNIDSGLGEISKEFRDAIREGKGYESENVKKEIFRIRKAWNKIMKERGKVVVFAHGGTNRMIISLVLGIEMHKARFGLNPAGITEIRVNEKGKVGIRHSNDTSHLPKSLRETQSE